jgi:NADP-dependent 3-hydroxy acid dehydrogenase YdfG
VEVLEQQYPDRALALALDVTDGAGVRESVNFAVCKLGGVDVS